MTEPATATRRHAAARIDLAAIRSNVEALRACTKAEVMAVVKADGYGHGLVPSARAAVDGGASWLGTAFLEEALAVRAAGLTVPLLCWLKARPDTSRPMTGVVSGMKVHSVYNADRVISLD